MLRYILSPLRRVGCVSIDMLNVNIGRLCSPSTVVGPIFLYLGNVREKTEQRMRNA